MTDYPLAEAEKNLAVLMDEVLAGGTVTISRQGRDAVELRPAARRAERVGPSRELLAEIATYAKALPRSERGVTSLLRDMRDEE